MEFRELNDSEVEGLKKLGDIQLKQDDEGLIKFEVVASTETQDRHGDTILLKNWDFKNYMKNPIILIDHWASVENIVGRATSIRRSKGQLIIKGVFSDVTEKARMAGELYQAGFLNAVSVGFRRNEGKNELLELSFVGIPANPDTLAVRGFNKLKELGLAKECENDSMANYLGGIFEKMASKSQDSKKEEVLTTSITKQEEKSKKEEIFTEEQKSEIAQIVKEALTDKKEEKPQEKSLITKLLEEAGEKSEEESLISKMLKQAEK